MKKYEVSLIPVVRKIMLFSPPESCGIGKLLFTVALNSFSVSFVR